MSGLTQLHAMGTAERRKEARTVIASSYLGSTIEYYDFLLYATAAAVAFPRSSSPEWTTGWVWWPPTAPSLPATWHARSANHLRPLR